jgi:hypothetical protein
MSVVSLAMATAHATRAYRLAVFHAGLDSNGLAVKSIVEASRILREPLARIGPSGVQASALIAAIERLNRANRRIDVRTEPGRLVSKALSDAADVLIAETKRLLVFGRASVL